MSYVPYFELTLNQYMFYKLNLNLNLEYEKKLIGNKNNYFMYYYDGEILTDRIQTLRKLYEVIA